MCVRVATRGCGCVCPVEGGWGGARFSSRRFCSVERWMKPFVSSSMKRRSMSSIPPPRCVSITCSTSFCSSCTPKGLARGTRESEGGDHVAQRSHAPRAHRTTHAATTQQCVAQRHRDRAAMCRAAHRAAGGRVTCRRSVRAPSSTCGSGVDGAVSPETHGERRISAGLGRRVGPT
eukprot:2022292-Prymnesium_polylepis.1